MYDKWYYATGRDNELLYETSGRNVRSINANRVNKKKKLKIQKALKNFNG